MRLVLVWLLLGLLTQAVWAQADPILGNWFVASVNGSGDLEGPPDPIPWSFEEAGQVHWGDHWAGHWTRKSELVYELSIITNQGQQDVWRVVLDSHHWFTCVKAGQVQGIGRR